MRIILENEMEKQAWPILLAAHYKWEKNHGDSISSQMEWYFNGLFKEETEIIVMAEAKARLLAIYGPDGGVNIIGVTEEQYIENGSYGLNDEVIDLVEFKKDLSIEYRELMADYEDDKISITEEVRDELRNIHYNLFNAPEDLTVEYNGEPLPKEGK